MNGSNPIVLMLVGPPRSGLSALFTSLLATGIMPVSSQDSNNLSVDSIDTLLFQELDCSSNMIGGLHENWISTRAAEKTRVRIRNMLSEFFSKFGVGMIVGSSLCRTLPLWIAVCEELRIEPRIILMVRHPWEVAQSLSADENKDLAEGHLIWLSHIRGAWLACQDYVTTLITFDQLLADPVTTLTHIGQKLSLLWLKDPWSAKTELLNHVQTELKRFHAAGLTDKDKQIYRPFEQLYHKIRFSHYRDITKAISVDPGSPDASKTDSIDKTILSNQYENYAELDLIDSLLARISHYDKLVSEIKNQQQRISARHGPALFAQIVFPSSRQGGEFLETIPLVDDEWNKISLSVPEPVLLRDNPLVFRPLNASGIVLISTISLVKQSTGEIVWAVNFDKGFEGITIEGSAVSMADNHCLKLMVLGNNSYLVFPKIPDMSDLPVEILIWIKATKDLEVTSSFLSRHLLVDRKYTVGTIHQLSCSGGTVMSKCLSAMPNVVLLSEINPCNPGGIRFNPFDPLQQFQKNYPELSYSRLDDLKKIFFERISWVLDKCRENNKFLVVRDHAHSDFLLKGCVDTPPLYSFLSELYTVKPIITLRNPIDSYLSLKANPNFSTDVNNFDAYCHRVSTFLGKYQFADVFLYEDFVNNPDQVLKEMCNIYGVEFDPIYRENFHKIILTGDSGRGNQFKEIKKIKRRPCDEAFYNEVMTSINFKKLSDKYPQYRDIEPFEIIKNLKTHKEPPVKLSKLPPKEKFGVLVIGYIRPMHLQSVLESLRQQDALSMTHIWLDGSASRQELSLSATAMCSEVAHNFTVRELRNHYGHMGIEKLMLDGLEFMSQNYDTFLILEDDCFPCSDAVSVFRKELEAIQTEASVFSVYGHHFETESEENVISRFQGWGWGTTADKINAILPKMRKLFNLSEKDYLEYIEKDISSDDCQRLDVTPGRDVLNVIRRHFSWDSCLSLITAQHKMFHKKTAKKTIYNFGLNTGSGHFNSNNDVFRKPPFNMITADEVWNFFYDRPSKIISNNTEYYGLGELDRLIADAIDLEKGFFVELGAFDGVTQNNSLYFEKQGWKGLLIEPVPSAYAKCKVNRPGAIVVNAACVPFVFDKEAAEIYDVGLMSTLGGSMVTDQQEDWLKRGEGFHCKSRQKLFVLAKPLSLILDENHISTIDMLILDVEGSEINVLQGLDFERHAPIYIVIEDRYEDKAEAYLREKGYFLDRTLLERQYTRDRLYRKQL